MKCSNCCEEVKHEGTMKTLVGQVPVFDKGPLHYHDADCHTRTYVCKCGNIWKESKKMKCDICGWVQNDECFCHKGKKVDEWTDPEEYISDEMMEFYKGIKAR